MKTKRRKHVLTLRLEDGQYLKMRLLPWYKTGKSYVWLVSLAVSKSKRQLNDWLNKRTNKRAAQLNNTLTGKVGPRTQAIAIRQLRIWVNTIPQNDCLTVVCESCASNKQFKIWRKWFTKHEDKSWIANAEFKYFLYCK
jgi:hypothetical protein